MNRHDILDEYACYAEGYLLFLEEKRKEIRSSMARLQRPSPPEEMPTPEALSEEAMEERPMWSVVPADVPDDAAVPLFEPPEPSAPESGMKSPITADDTTRGERDIWHG